MHLKLVFLTITTISLFAISCTGHPNAVVYTKAIQTIAKNPKNTANICARIPQEVERTDCLFWGARTLVQLGELSMGEDICSKLPSASVAAFECAFVLAEHSNNADYCSQSGPFEEDCRMHLLNQNLKNYDGHDWPTLIDSAGLSPERDEPWIVIYRNILSAPPLDLKRCKDMPAPQLCIQTGQDLFRDKLRMLRDRGALTCDPTKWPSDFQFLQDEHLVPLFVLFTKDIQCSG